MSHGSTKPSANTLQNRLNVWAAISLPNRFIAKDGIAKPVITPTGTVDASFLRSPLFVAGQNLYVVRLTFIDRLPKIQPQWITVGRFGYTIFSRRLVPIWKEDGDVFTGGELAEGSIVRLAIEPYEPLPLLKEVMVQSAKQAFIFADHVSGQTIAVSKASFFQFHF